MGGVTDSRHQVPFYPSYFANYSLPGDYTFLASAANYSKYENAKYDSFYYQYINIKMTELTILWQAVSLSSIKLNKNLLEWNLSIEQRLKLEKIKS